MVYGKYGTLYSCQLCIELAHGIPYTVVFCDAPPINQPTPPITNLDSQKQTLELTCPRLEGNGDKFTKKLYLCSQGTGTRKIDVTVSIQLLSCIM